MNLGFVFVYLFGYLPFLQIMKNKETNCGVTLCMEILGSKWKPIIIFRISKGVNRFNKLINVIDGINRQMLSKQLKQLERSGVLKRTTFAEIPPRVEYTITPLGTSLLPVIKAMEKWGTHHLQGTKKVKTASKLKTTDKNSQQLPLFD